MRWTVLITALAMCLSVVAGAQTEPARQTESLQVGVVALHAFSQNRGEKVFDQELEGIKDALSDLEFDTFQHLSSTTLTATPETEAPYKINSRYTLYVKALPEESQGQSRLSVRIEMSPKDPAGKPLNAVCMTLALKPEKKLKLRGLKLDSGELVVVLTLKED